MKKYPRVTVLGCRINRTNRADAIDAVFERIGTRQGGYVCFANVHTVVTAQTDNRLLNATNNSFLALPDGLPVAVVANFYDDKITSRVAGPDFMESCMSELTGVRHFFYGSSDETLTKLISQLKERYPSITIVGKLSPPFRQLADDEQRKHIELINATKPEVIWVGLGAPKQEYWMARNWQDLKPAILIGVGAAFDFSAGVVKRAPIWMQKVGLEWLHRLFQDPGRLWRRYIVTNTLFLWYLVKNNIALFRANR